MEEPLMRWSLTFDGAWLLGLAREFLDSDHSYVQPIQQTCLVS